MQEKNRVLSATNTSFYFRDIHQRQVLGKFLINSIYHNPHTSQRTPKLELKREKFFRGETRKIGIRQPVEREGRRSGKLEADIL